MYVLLLITQIGHALAMTAVPGFPNIASCETAGKRFVDDRAQWGPGREFTCLRVPTIFD
jgi:hypothetical protein